MPVCFPETQFFPDIFSQRLTAGQRRASIQGIAQKVLTPVKKAD